MHKLLYCTTQSGYSAQIGDGVISQELDGGAPRFKRALKGTYHSATVRWVVKDDGVLSRLGSKSKSAILGETLY